MKELNETKLDMEAEPRNHAYFAAPSPAVLSPYDTIRCRWPPSLSALRGFFQNTALRWLLALRGSRPIFWRWQHDTCSRLCRCQRPLRDPRSGSLL